MLSEFFSHADEHPHGWGFARFSKKHDRIEHSCDSAEKSEFARDLTETNPKVNNAIAHIRHATIGHVELVNCHPFSNCDKSGRRWTLQHKGTVFDSPTLNPYIHAQTGGTDSERVLLYLIERLNEEIEHHGRPLEPQERFRVFERMVAELSPKNALALMVYDNDYLFVHSNYVSALKTHELDGGIVFSTEELAAVKHLLALNGSGAPDGESSAEEIDLTWKPLPICRAFAYKNGELVFEGKKHDGEYIYREEDMKNLYQDFAAL
jgi:glutamine amidotransferase